MRRLAECPPASGVEVASGSGGLTGALLAALPPERSEYLFTDPDDGMVVRAETRFAGLLSLPLRGTPGSAGLAEQGFDKACHDIVVAGAALATSPDLDRDLAVVSGLLKPGGLLMMSVPKAGGFLDVATLTHPSLLNAAKTDWRQALANAGFEEAVEVGGANPGALCTTILGRKPAGSPEPEASEIDPALWLVFANDGAAEPASVLMRRLEQLDRRVVLVDENDRFERLGLNRFASRAAIAIPMCGCCSYWRPTALRPCISSTCGGWATATRPIRSPQPGSSAIC